MRVAIVGPYPKDKEKILGGVQSVTFRLADALSKLPGVEVHAITLDTSLSSVEHQQHGGIYEHYVPSTDTLGGVTFFSIDRGRIRRVLRDINPDVVHVHGAMHYPPCVWHSGFPWLLTPHGMVGQEAKSRHGIRSKLRIGLDVAYEKWAFGTATDIVAISEYVLQFVKPYAKGKIHQICNPISDDYFQLTNEEIPNTILFAGAIIPRKGVMFLFKAMKELKDRGVKCKLNLCGIAPIAEYAEELKKYRKENQLEDYIDWLGKVPEGQLHRLYSECAVYVLPSLEETQPISIGQAMAVGKAVVGTRSAGIPFMVDDGKTGFLVDYGDPIQLADKIQTVLNDNELRRAMGQAARSEALKKYASDSVAKSHLQIYQEIINTSKSAHS